MKLPLLLLLICFLNGVIYAQKTKDFTGKYQSVDYTQYKYLPDSLKYIEIDTVWLQINKDSTFVYHWSPTYGENRSKHFETTGTWYVKYNKLYLNSKYQWDELEFIETYKPSIPENERRIYIQTKDSVGDYLIGLKVGVLTDSFFYKRLNYDTTIPHNAGYASFKRNNIKRIYLFDFHILLPYASVKNPESNHFILRFNHSKDPEYQYFKNYKIYIKNDKVFFTRRFRKFQGLKKL